MKGSFGPLLYFKRTLAQKNINIPIFNTVFLSKILQKYEKLPLFYFVHEKRLSGYAMGENKEGGEKRMMDKIALLLVIIGAVNWGLVGVFQFDLVASIFGGQGALISRIIYTLVGAAGLWSISLLFRDRDPVKD